MEEVIERKDMAEIIGVQCNMYRIHGYSPVVLFLLTWEENSFQILLGIRNSVQGESVLCKTMKLCNLKTSGYFHQILTVVLSLATQC